MKKKRQHIKKGQYYTMCCHLDMERAKKGFYEDIEDTGQLDVWNSKTEAVLSLAKRWAKSSHPREAIEALLCIFKKY